MPSPFPGMDPYVESQWRSFHGLFIGAITALLNRSLPAGLVAQMEEDVRVESLADDFFRDYAPDVSVIEPGFDSTPIDSPTAMIPAAGLVIRRSPRVHRDIRVIDVQSGNRVVTAVEVLNPWNKLAGRLNRDSCRKLTDLEEADANWVQIDLLRSSRNHMPVTWDDIPSARQAHYLVLAYRAAERSLTAYPISIRQVLPAIPFPLRPQDPGLPLDLQSAFDRAYGDGPFRAIDYTMPLDFPLADSDAEWAAGLTRRK